MNVAELIEYLKKMPTDLPVMFWDKQFDNLDSVNHVEEAIHRKIDGKFVALS
jgi:hypothetical protein